MSLTIEDIETEYWAHHFCDNPNEDVVVDEEFDLDAELALADKDAADLPDDFEDI